MSRINTNISSIQAMHRLIGNQQDLSLRLERLSSGLRINRGRDDPAGLIASESLRSEITGLNQAIENSTRAVNVISTAEGSLNEVSALLLEMRGLINKSANEGALSPQEIEANQLQIDSILASIDRVANTTQFNGVKLLNGSLDYVLSADKNNFADIHVYGANIPEGSYQDVMVEVKASAKVAQYKWTHSALAANESVTLQITGNKGSQIVSFAASTTASQMKQTINSYKDLTGVSATCSGARGALILSSVGYGASAYVSVTPIAQNTTSAFDEDTKYGVNPDVRVNGQEATSDGLVATIRSGGLDLELTFDAAFAGGINTDTFRIKGGGALFQLGPDVRATGQYRMGIQSVHTGRLGNAEVGRLSEIGRGGSASIVGKNYEQAQRIVDVAIQQVATLRGRLGGFQKNQLETNINSQRIALENVKASESAIRDADYATETAAMTRAQILVQSTTQILAMANQQPQNVLSLLGR